MKSFRVFCVAACLVFLPGAVPAQDQSGTAPADKVQIITDQDAGAVRILIDGREVATIDADGLHVAGNIAYTGSLIDATGQTTQDDQHAQ